MYNINKVAHLNYMEYHNPHSKTSRTTPTHATPSNFDLFMRNGRNMVSNGYMKPFSNVSYPQNE